MMIEALSLAQRAAGRTSPNPLVGAVVVSGGQVVGRAFHARAGDDHAEVAALRQAGARAQGATLYLTLEPCNHTGRTDPCTEAVIAAGIRRVVAAMPDPDPRVNGQGIARLRAAGLQVEVGLLEDRARRANEFYLKHRRTGLPFVTLKWAASLDGKIAARRGSATAITGEAARRYAHTLRNIYDAVLVGVGTVLADDPLLTCRLPADGAGGGPESLSLVPPVRQPLRVVVDSRLRTPIGARVVTSTAEAPTLIATTAAAPPDRVQAMREAGVDVLVQEHSREQGHSRGQEHSIGQVDLCALMQELGRRGVLSVLIEGGGTVNAAALSAGIVDKVIALIAPRLIGGAQAPTPLDRDGLEWVAGAVRLRDVRLRPLGEDFAIEGYLEA